jgi:hypothetical protein
MPVGKYALLSLLLLLYNIVDFHVTLGGAATVGPYMDYPWLLS